jgi:hypothetical protein
VCRWFRDSCWNVQNALIGAGRYNVENENALAT